MPSCLPLIVRCGSTFGPLYESVHCPALIQQLYGLNSLKLKQTCKESRISAGINASLLRYGGLKPYTSGMLTDRRMHIIAVRNSHVLHNKPFQIAILHVYPEKGVQKGTRIIKSLSEVAFHDAVHCPDGFLLESFSAADFLR